MQTLRSSLTMCQRWWLLGGLGLLVGLGVLLALRTCQAQPVSPARSSAPVSLPTLTWTYAPAAPEQFVVRRSIDGGTWQDVAVLLGASGTGLTWQDTTLSAPAEPVVAQYVVYAVTAGAWSETSNRAIATLGGLPRRPVETVTVVRADSSETQAGKHQARLAGDGAPATMWHTKWSGTPAPLPHWIVLDLGAAVAVDGLAYLPRQDGSAQGRIGQYEIAVSQDNAAWSEPVAVGTWLWYEKPLEQYVRWPAVAARYVRLKSLTEASGGPWSAAAEVGLYAALPVPAPIALGACVLEQPSATTTRITCQQP